MRLLDAALQRGGDGGAEPPGSVLRRRMEGDGLGGGTPYLTPSTPSRFLRGLLGSSPGGDSWSPGLSAAVHHAPLPYAPPPPRESLQDELAARRGF